MAEVTMYCTAACPYCVRAKMLLQRKGAAVSEVRVDYDLEQRRIMLERSGGRTSVPQIFIGDLHVGGCDDLYALERAGKLDPLLAEAG